MNEESLELDLDLGNDENINNRSQERIKDLSSKVRDTATERDEARAAAEAAKEAQLAAEKKAEFLESFSEIASKYPNSAEYKAQIEERVQKGYSIEDAAISVLASEGKYTPPEPEGPIVDSQVGGSAPTVLPSGDGRNAGELTQAERRSLLIEADKRGEVSEILKRGL